MKSKCGMKKKRELSTETLTVSSQIEITKADGVNGIICTFFCPSASKCLYAIIRAVCFGFSSSRHAWKWFCLLDENEKKTTPRATTATTKATDKFMWL